MLLHDYKSMNISPKISSWHSIFITFFPMALISPSFVLFALLPLALQVQAADVPAWGQCGGIGYTGSTTCSAGLVCQQWNPYYFQCVPGTSTTTTSSTRSTSTSTTRSTSSTRSTTTSTSTRPSTSSTATSKSTSTSKPTSTSTPTPSSTKISTTSTVSYSGTLPVVTASPTGLASLAKPKGIYIGSAFDNNRVSDTTYSNIVLSNVNQITCENSMKWESIEATQGVFSSYSADEMIKLAQLNSLTMRGHTLVWHSQLPSWVSNGSWTNATLTDVMIKHITGVMNKYKGLIHTWDVVNEAIGDDGTMRPSVFYNTIGETYIDIAFKTAKSLDSKPILAINDYNIEGSGAKSTAMLNLVSRVKGRGAPIEQIGIQSHLVVGSLPGGIDALWASYAALGVSIACVSVNTTRGSRNLRRKKVSQSLISGCPRQRLRLASPNRQPTIPQWSRLASTNPSAWVSPSGVSVTNTLGSRMCSVAKVRLCPSTNRCKPNRHTLPSKPCFPAKCDGLQNGSYSRMSPSYTFLFLALLPEACNGLAWWRAGNTPAATLAANSLFYILTTDHDLPHSSLDNKDAALKKQKGPTTGQMTLFVPLSPESGPSPSSTQESPRLPKGAPATLKRPQDSRRHLERAAQTIAKAKRVVVVCGAGISVQAGIPDFRSTTGLFHQLKKEHPKESLSSGRELFDAHHVFHSESTASIFYKMVARLASLAEQAAPTPFHEMLKGLDDRGQLIRCYTQNIDGIEERAGLTFGVPPIVTRQSPKKSVKRPVKKEEEAKAVAALSEEAVVDGGSTATSSVAVGSSTPVSLTPPLVAISPPTSQQQQQRVTPSIDSTPRCIPLHGTLKSIHCTSCGSTSPLSQHTSLFSQGFAPPCMQCSEFEHTRQLVGKRLRGVGIMRPSIVLYNEDHREGESVGDVVRKDLTGGRTKRAPPDLLIVAGTSLKVPGTKRIVKEFSKAARSGIKRAARRQNTRGTGSSTPKGSSGGPSRRGKKTSSGEDNSAEDEDEAEGDEEDESEDDEEELSSEESEDEEERPIRTIYLNLDFPIPSKEWESMFDVWVQGDVQEFAMMVKNAMEAGTKQRPGRRSARLGANKTSAVDKPPSSGPSTRANSKRKREPEADNPMVVDETPASTVSVESPVIEGEMAGVNQDSLLRSTATLSISDDVVTETGYSKRRKITPTNSESNLSTQGMAAQQKYHGFISTSPVEIDADQGHPFTPLSRTHQSSTDSDRPRPPERRVSTLSSLLLPEEKDNKHADAGRYLDHNRGERQLSTSNTSQVERFRSTPPPLSYPTLPPFHTLLEVASPKKQGYEHRREDDRRRHHEWNNNDRHESRHHHYHGSPQHTHSQHSHHSSHHSHQYHQPHAYPHHQHQHQHHAHTHAQHHAYSQHRYHEHASATSFRAQTERRDMYSNSKPVKRRQTISYQSFPAGPSADATPTRHPYHGGVGGRTVAPIRKPTWNTGFRHGDFRYESGKEWKRERGASGIVEHGRTSSSSSQRMMIDTHV